MQTMTQPEQLKKQNKAPIIDIICDLDGCLIDTSWIWRLVDGFNMTEEQKYKYFDLNANSTYSAIDTTLLTILNYCRQIMIAHRIIFLTARSEVIAAPTINFLQARTGLVAGKDFLINFRPVDDKLSPVESKRVRLLKILEQGHQILFAIDDEPEICKMYCEHKINGYLWRIGTVPVDLLLRLGGDLGKIMRGGRDLICMN